MAARDQLCRGTEEKEQQQDAILLAHMKGEGAIISVHVFNVHKNRSGCGANTVFFLLRRVVISNTTETKQFPVRMPGFFVAMLMLFWGTFSVTYSYFRAVEGG